MQFRFNEELVAIDDTDDMEADDRLKRVVTSQAAIVAAKSSSRAGYCTTRGD